MKTTKNILSALLFCAVAGAFIACSKSEDKNDKSVKVEPVSTPVKNTGELKLAYVLLDTLQNQYQFFKDVDAEIKTKSEGFEAQMKQAEQSVINKQSQMEKKYNSGGYTSQEQFQADQQAAQRLLQNAQALEQKLQGELQQFILEKQQAVNDTIQNVMDQYAKAKGYDFIFSKSSSIDHLLYANKAYDVTEEVVAILNKLYVGKSVEEIATKDKKAEPAKEKAVKPTEKK